MQVYTHKRRWKVIIIVMALTIGVSSLWYTNLLMRKLSEEERKKIELWSKAMQVLLDSDSDQDVSFVFDVLFNNNTIPVVLVDTADNVISFRNIDSVRMSKPEFCRQKVLEMKDDGRESFLITDSNGIVQNRVYYSDSDLLRQLSHYPYVQLSVVFMFIFMSYWIFSVSRRAEQDQVWLGMSKETAHQLGTPISSLMAWLEILKTTADDAEMIDELGKDIRRLEKITARFSKIGSQPELERHDLLQVLSEAVDYMQMRIPSSISVNVDFPKDKIIYSTLNSDLFEWVIENLCKNAVDAIGQDGRINIKVETHRDHVHIDVSDTGKGMPKSRFKSVFNPGYTTKNRGWGLGLSLAKRIIEQYHKGKIFVKSSEIGNGTTFRIVLFDIVTV